MPAYPKEYLSDVVENQGKLFDLAVNQYNSNTAEDASINGKPNLIDLKNGEKVILVLLPLKKHMDCFRLPDKHSHPAAHRLVPDKSKRPAA
mgnify:CR=1 FL=1